MRDLKVNSIKLIMYKDTPYVNRIIKKREHQRSMEYHLQNIRQARPITRSPDSEMLHINNKKKEYQKEVRFTEIERENRILLEKISGIMGKNKRSTFNGPSQANKSLNSGFRKRQLQDIEVENARFLRRLQDKKSDYETNKFNEDWKKQQNTMKIMANYPLILTDRPRPKRHSIGQFSQKNKVDQTDIQMVRVRVLSGINFLITVRLTRKMLQITGDCKETKEIKVIEILRPEALQFIQEECQGRVDLIFDHLRYDTEESVLYLIGNQVQINDILGKRAQHNKQLNVNKQGKQDERNVQTAQQHSQNYQEENEEQIPLKEQKVKEEEEEEEEEEEDEEEKKRQKVKEGETKIEQSKKEVLKEQKEKKVAVEPQKSKTIQKIEQKGGDDLPQQKQEIEGNNQQDNPEKVIEA